MRIGLSYDEGRPKYRLYLGALVAAAERFGYNVEAEWLAGVDQRADTDTLNHIEGLILTGGADVEPSRYGFDDPAHVCQTLPDRDEAEFAILTAAIERRIPIFAICRGTQLLNVACGGTLMPDLATSAAHRLADEERHHVAIESRTTLAHMAETLEGATNSSHHQAIDRLGTGLRISARHADGTIEAIEWAEPMRKAWLTAVQWHPERMSLDEPLCGPLYRGFFEAVLARST